MPGLEGAAAMVPEGFIDRVDMDRAEKHGVDVGAQRHYRETSTSTAVQRSDKIDESTKAVSSNRSRAALGGVRRCTNR